MGGGPSITYNAPKVEPDRSFERYLAYQQERETRAEAKAEEERKAALAKEEARKAAGAAGYSGLRTGVESQLRQGLISYSDAASQLRDFAQKYELTPPEADVSALTKVYTEELLPGRRKTGISSAYEELLGRQATEEEQTKALERFNQGYYQTNEDLRNALVKGSEYQDKFNQSYLDNYYDTQFGKQTLDEAGKRTGKRTFTFDKNLLPTYAETTKERTGVVTPEFQSQFTGTPAEIEEQLQNVRETRKYLYSAGLTNLQGEIDKETQKLKNEGAQTLQKIKAQGDIYTQLVGSFSF